MKLFCSPKSVNRPCPTNRNRHVCDTHFGKFFFNTGRTEDSGDSCVQIQAYRVYVCVCAL